MADTQFLLITGLSGSGKSLVHNCLEDIGYYCVDNLPLSLIDRFFDLIEETSGEIRKVALVTDVREKAFLTDFIPTLRDLRSRFRVRLVFLEASDEVLLRRFSETRRPHPLGVHEPLAKALAMEREKLAPIRELADDVIDTSSFNVHEFRDHVRSKYGAETGSDALVVSVLSFGFKHGVPRDADLVFDVRFLPNPHFVPEYRGKTGRDHEVIEFVKRTPESGDLFRHLISFLSYLLPLYVREGKSYLTIAIGCTGGKHRSVVIADELALMLKDQRYVISVSHRDIKRP